MESVFYGRYQLIDKIAAGGMAEVYKAKYETFGGIEKQVIVKRILPQYSNDEEFIRMFLDEAKITVALSHVNLVQVFDFGQVEGNYYIAMEYVEGADLQSVLRECHFRRIPIPMELSVLLVAEVLRGLDYAHRRIDPSSGKKMNIVHRDISPANILISFSGNVKVADFGIAKAKTKSSHTQVGTLKGKYSYMSPEQARGAEVDFRSDIFSCGIILYELVTGVRPFRSKTNSELEILERVKEARYEPPRNVNPHIPARLAEIIDTSLAKDAGKRFQETGVFCDRLTGVMSEFETRPDTSHLSKFLRKVFAEDGKKNRTDLSALMEKAIDAKGSPPAAEKKPAAAVSTGVPQPFGKKKITDELPPFEERDYSKSSDASKSTADGGRVDVSVSASGSASTTEDLDADAETAEQEPMGFAVAALHYRKPEGDDADQRLREFLGLVEDEVANRGGRVEQRTDTGLIACFQQDEHAVDHRLRAVETARKIVDLGKRPGSEMPMTAGICSVKVAGVASVKSLAGAMKRAEKLADRAESAGVLVDEDVAKHVGDGFVLRRAGELDGVAAFSPIRAAKGADRPSRRNAPGSRTVGREAEQKKLQQRLDEVLGGHGPRAIALTGAPGMGKSHLVHELIRTAAAAKGASVILGRCVAAGRQVPFSVFQDLVRDLLGLPDGAGREATGQRLERAVQELNLAPSIPALLKPLYAGARSVQPEQIPPLANGLRELLAGMSAGGKSIVMVIEDLHWADEPSRGVIAKLVDSLRRERVLVLLTARPDVDREWLAARRTVEELRLAALDDAAILKIAADRLQLPTLSPELGDHLRGKARGNPYYLLETIRGLNDRGLGGGAATNRQDLTQDAAYSPVIARPQVLSDRSSQAVNRAKDAITPQVQGLADDARRAITAAKPVVQKALDSVLGAIGFVKNVKKGYDPKKTEVDGEE